MDRSDMQKYVKSAVEVSTVITSSNIAHYWNRCC